MKKIFISSDHAGYNLKEQIKKKFKYKYNFYDLIKKIGARFDLTEDMMNSCLADNNAQDEILNQRIEAQKKYKIKSTPTILVNEKEYTGKVDYEKFKKIIEKNL